MDSSAGWLHRVALNLASDRFRRLQAERRAQRVERRVSAEANDHAQAIAIRQAVAKLPRRQKKAVVLRDFLDLCIDETARLVDRPETP